MAGVEFFNIEQFMNTKDKNGKRPEVFIITSNRGIGKTYGSSMYMVSTLWIENKVQSIILVPNATMLKGIASGKLGEYVNKEYPDYRIVEGPIVSGSFLPLYLVNVKKDEKKNDRVPFTYVVAINHAGSIKDHAATFYKVGFIFWDEFQRDGFKQKDVDDVINIHMSVARGGGHASRYVPLLCCSNSLSVNNPLFETMGISGKIKSTTKIYKGDGFVVYRGVNKTVQKEQNESTFNRVFSNSKEIRSAIDNSWLNDDDKLIAKPDKSWGGSWYVCTLVGKNETYGVRVYDDGNYYISRGYDGQNTRIYGMIEDSEHVYIKKSTFGQNLRKLYWLGRVWFCDGGVKNNFKEYIM